LHVVNKSPELLKPFFLSRFTYYHLGLIKFVSHYLTTEIN